MDIVRLQALVEALMRRHVFRALAIAALAAIASDGRAQDWPSRTVSIVNLFGAGGSGDFASRVAAKALSDKFGQPFVVDNRPGAGGSVGSTYVAKSKPDGYTLLMTATGPAVLNQLLFKSASYDTERDFAPVILVGELPQVIVAGPQFKTLKDLIDYGRANPGKLNIGHAGAGSTGHLAAALLAARSGIQATFVGYRSANAVVADVLSGQIQAGIPLYVPSVNTVNVLAVTSEQRVSFLPNIPTAREAGSELVASTWVGLLAPQGTPADIVARINTTVDEYIKSKEGIETFAKANIRAIGGSAAHFGQTIRQDRALWAPVIAKENIQLEPN
jgi:tripartite-type tricarboxylate transporter receptor subunit TctC